MVGMRPLLALAALAAVLPAAVAQTGLGLGGLAPASAPGPATSAANIDVPTDLCEREFCLQAAPAACGGNCILTPLGNTTQVGSLSSMHTDRCGDVSWASNHAVAGQLLCIN